MGLIGLIAAAAAALQGPSAAQDCQEALGSFYEGIDEAELPGQVDGATIAGRDALLALRRERGEALITVRGGDFSGADFSGARLHNICFIETNLADSDWREAEANGVGFVRADLSGANLAGARLRGVLLRAPNLANADASGADLSGGRFDGGWQGSVDNLRLDRADLSGFRFDCGITIGDSCANDGRVSLRGADLSGAALNTWWGDADLAGARIDRTEVSLGQLGALRDARIVGPIRVRGGEAVAELSAAEHRALLPHLVDESDFGAPSFDCARASRPVERLICSEAGAHLRPADRELAELYRQALAADPAVAEAQRRWLADRDRCPVENGDDSGCVFYLYERRRAELIAALGPPPWLRPGTHAYFAQPPAVFDEAFRGDPLYRRLVPVMTGAAWSRVLVRVNADGTIDAYGDAIGGNAHSCSLGGERLAFDLRTGWYSGPQPTYDDDPPEWRGRPMPVLLFNGDEAEVWQAGHVRFETPYGDPRSSQYASCGARAGFGRMVRMPLPEAEARTLFESYQAE